jgi:hypothetical protein
MKMQRGLVLGLCLMGSTTAFAQSPPYGGNFCGFEIRASNANRHVFGVVQTECTYGCPPSSDSHPFGNWGVDSFFGNRFDGHQYMGWANFNRYCNEQMDSPEWNSCTSDLSLRGDSQYYNDQDGGGYDRQVSNSEQEYGAQMLWLDANEEEGCTRWDGHQLAFGGDILDIYELDPPIFIGDRDDYLTTINVPGSAVILSCPARDFCAPFESDWTPAGNDITDAIYKYRGTMSCLYIEGKGCT